MNKGRSGNCINLARARFSRILDCVLRLQASDGEDVEALDRLRTYVEADLLGRDRPIDMPLLYDTLRGTSTLPFLAEVVDDVSQQFLMAGKRVTSILLVLATRVQCECEGFDPLQGRLVANMPPLHAFERALLERMKCELVSFDPRLYSPPLLGLVAPRQIREHARSLICGRPPDAPVVLRPLVPQKQPDWRIFGLLGAVVHPRTNWIDTSAPIAIGPVELAKADLCVEELHAPAGGPEIQVECRAHGVHYLRGGVRLAEDVRRGLRIGTLHFGADAYASVRGAASASERRS